MSLQLLAGEIQPWVYAVAAVLGLALVLYGFFRRFSRMGWWGYQIALIFACIYVFGLMPLPSDPLMRFIAVAVAAFVISGVIIGFGAIIRTVVTKPRRKRPGAFVLRLFDGLLGVITAVVNLVVFVVAIGAPVVLGLDYAGVGVDLFAMVKAIPGVWGVIELFGLDFLIIALLVVAIKGGYRLGLLRTVWTVIMLLLGVAAFAGSIVASFMLPGIKDISAGIATGLSGTMDAFVAQIVGCAIVSLVCFLVCVLILVLLNLLVGLGVREVKQNRVLRVIDGVIISAVFYVLMLAIICGVNLLFAHILSGNLGEWAYDFFTQSFDFMGFVTTSPLSKFLYKFNVFRLFF